MVRAYNLIDFLIFKEQNESEPLETENNETIVDIENEDFIEERKTDEYESEHNENIETLEDNTIEKMINEEIGDQNDSNRAEELINDKEKFLNYSNKVENNFQKQGILFDSIIICSRYDILNLFNC